MKLTKNRLYIVMAMVFSTISSMSVLLCIIDTKTDAAEQKIIFIASLLFWSGLLIEQIFIGIAGYNRRKLAATEKNNGKKSLPGILSFFKTKLGTASDIVLIVSIVIYLILYFTKTGIDFGQFIVLFFIVLSFRFHCISNGVNYTYKSENKKRGAKS